MFSSSIDNKIIEIRNHNMYNILSMRHQTIYNYTVYSGPTSAGFHASSVCMGEGNFHPMIIIHKPAT